MNLEPMPWTHLRTIAEARALITASGRSALPVTQRANTTTAASTASIWCGLKASVPWRG